MMRISGGQKKEIRSRVKLYGGARAGGEVKVQEETRRHKGDMWIGLFTFLLLMMGLIVIYAIGPLRANFMNAAYGTNVRANDFFVKQGIMVFLAMIAFVVMSKVQFEFVRKFMKIVILVGLIMCLGLMVLAAMNSKLARCELGACRWYNFGFMGFQPAELLKIGLVLYFAEFLAEKKREGKMGVGRDFWIPFAVVSVLSLFFVVVKQKDMGTGASMVAIILAMLLVSGVQLWKFGLICTGIVVAGMGFIMSSPHRMERFLTFRGGEGADKYHIENAMLAIGTGGLLGVGVGNSVQATGYLPESINDSVFAIMGETFGFLGLFVVMMLFYVLMRRLLVSAGQLVDPVKRNILVGMFAWLGSQVAINIMAMTGLIPLTGVTLPLLSFGGTSIVFISGMLGLCFMLSSFTEREEIS